MKSYGQLWDRITSEENLRSAWRRVRKGHTAAPEMVRFGERLDENLSRLRDDLASGRYSPGKYRQFNILDPKPRTISCAPVRDRVVHHALCGVIAPLIERGFIRNTFACREGKGAHRACDLARRYMGEYKYFCKMDVRHYFDSIDHEKLLAVLLPKFREVGVRRLIETIVRHPVPGQVAGKGLPIGNLTSQWFANGFLDEFDHLAQSGFGKGGVGYIRYMDDIVFFADMKGKTWELHDAAKNWLPAFRKLEIKDEATVLAPTTEALPFLGLRILKNSWRFGRERFLRTRRTYRERCKEYLRGDISEDRFARSAASSFGSLRWFGFKNILQDLASGQGASSGSNRVQRGGNWNNDSNNCRSSNRNNNNPSNSNNNNGFRLSSTLPGHDCQGPARDASAPLDLETNMQQPGRPVANAKAAPGEFKVELRYE